MAKEKKAAKPKKEAKAKKEPKPKKEAKGKKAASAAPSAAAPFSAAPASGPQPAKKRGRLLSVLLLIAIGVGAFFLVRMALHEADYKSAQNALDKGSYKSAAETFEKLGTYKDAGVLRNYALARWLYSEGLSTNGAVLDQVGTCLDAIPADYSGDMAGEISKFRKDFGSYHQNWTSYKSGEAQSDSGSTVSSGAAVKHRGNFYTAFKEFYESAAHFWDEDEDAS